MVALDEARTLHTVGIIRAAGADMARFRDDKAYCADLGVQFYVANMMCVASLCLGRGLDPGAPMRRSCLATAYRCSTRGG